jgi:hypothetical protein
MRTSDKRAFEGIQGLFGDISRDRDGMDRREVRRDNPRQGAGTMTKGQIPKPEERRKGGMEED